MLVGLGGFVTEEGYYLSPPVQRAARLLRHIAEGDPITNMAQTARDLGINRTTLIRLIHTLEVERFIEPVGAGRPGWRVGIGLIGLAAQAFFSEDLVQISVPVLTRLTELVGLSAHLGVLDGPEIVYIVRRVPNRSFASHIKVGSRLPAHAVSMGRIMLAHMPISQVHALFAGGSLAMVTDKTATTIESLLEMVGRDREAGVAWSDGQYEQGITSVAAAVFDAAGTPIAAINVSGQTNVFGKCAKRRTIEDVTKKAAAEISLHFGWRGSHETASDAIKDQ